MFSKNWSEPVKDNPNQFRQWIVLIVLFLNLFGILVIYDASSIQAWHLYKDPMFYLKRQLLYSMVGYIFFVLALGIDIDRFKKLIPLFLGIGICALIAVLLPGIGRRIGGARRWLTIFGWNIQPSEIVKFLYISYAAVCVSEDEPSSVWYRKRVWAAFFFMICGLLILEPDLGMIIFLFMFTVLMLFLKGVDLKKLAVPMIAGVLILAILILTSPYRRARIISYINPWRDFEGKGFQIIQSQIAFGRGGLIGTGLGGSIQRLFYLPAAYTDFIYSIIGEEFGLIGSVSVLSLFFFLLYYGNKLRLNIKDSFRQVLALGILCMFALEIILNMGVSLGMFPTKGLPLPFISYGGSSLVVNFFALGMLLNTSR